MSERWTAYCDKCGKKFDSNDAVEERYSEYVGASLNSISVSPCCGAEFSDYPPEEDE